MIRKFVFPLLAVVGLVLAVYAVKATNTAPPTTQPIASPPRAPYPSYVAGAGLIEASTENIAIGTLVPGVVVDVAVQIGQRVKAGDPLFATDDAELKAQANVEQASIRSAEEQLTKLTQSPRPEDVPPLEAKARSAEANASRLQREFERLDRAGEGVSRDERDRAFFAAESARADLAAAQADLARTKAGAWAPDLAIARAAVEAARSRLAAVNVEIARRTVRAPIDATVLQVKVRRGEYASAGPLATPLMLLGNVDTLHVRVDIDENDAWRVRDGAKAQASARGNRLLKTDLAFVRMEPYIVPKRSLTGDSSERVDTRVLQAIYAFDAAAFEKANGSRVYPGQQMDVFIESDQRAGGVAR